MSPCDQIDFFDQERPERDTCERSGGSLKSIEITCNRFTPSFVDSISRGPVGDVPPKRRLAGRGGHRGDEGVGAEDAVLDGKEDIGEEFVGETPAALLRGIRCNRPFGCVSGRVSSARDCDVSANPTKYSYEASELKAPKPNRHQILVKWASFDSQNAGQMEGRRLRPEGNHTDRVSHGNGVAIVLHFREKGLVLSHIWLRWGVDRVAVTFEALLPNCYQMAAYSATRRNTSRGRLPFPSSHVPRNRSKRPMRSTVARRSERVRRRRGHPRGRRRFAGVRDRV
jgi:hypothetical protein